MGGGNNVNPYLSHHAEKRSRHALLVWKSTLGDEQRSTGEHKVCPEYDYYRARKPVRPIGLPVLDEGKEYVPKRCQKRTDACGCSIALYTERRIATGDTPHLLIRYTTGTLPTNKAIKMLHMIPVTKLGNSRTIVRIGERRR